MSERYDTVLVEGSGRRLVRLTEYIMPVDDVKDAGIPVVLVAPGGVGGIDHTFLGLKTMQG